MSPSPPSSRLHRRLLLLATTTAGAASLPLAGCERRTAPTPATGTQPRPPRAPDPFDSDSSPRR